MKKRIVLALTLLFALFTLGAVFSMYYINVTARRLDSLVSLHQVEIMRQDLIIKVQEVQTDLYAVNTVFGRDLSTIINDVHALDMAVSKCFNCHHEPEVSGRLAELRPLLEEYKQRMSQVITTSANVDRLEHLKVRASSTGTEILKKSQAMTFVAAQKLHERTITALREIKNSRNILIVTLVAAFFIALLIAVSLTRGITRPVSELLISVRRIAAGEFSHAPSYHRRDEFGELAAAFNNMRLALRESKDRIMNFVRQLSGLYGTTLSIHTVTELSEMVKGLPAEVSGLLNVERCGLFIAAEDGPIHVHGFPSSAPGHDESLGPGLTTDQMKRIFDSSRDGVYLSNAPAGDALIRECCPGAASDRNLLMAWIHRKGRILGLILASNKSGDDFREEDAQLLSILASHMAVAIENSRLYENLKQQMREVQRAQEQLIQSTKLAAIGELASNVAHEINNPLTSILGYTELLKEEDDIETIKTDLQIIEQESLRARTIVRQLLEFSRRRPLDIQTADINQIIQEVIPLVRSQARAARVEIARDLLPLPSAAVDANQLKQVFINLINNAVQAMSDGGTLTIGSRDEGDRLAVVFQDTGGGIPEETIPRIFEPFFSTKKEKGTGLGLSISYSIIQNHGGSLSVESRVGEGTRFTIRLPIKAAAPLIST